MANATDESERIVAALHWPGWHQSAPAKDPAAIAAERRYELVPPGMKLWDGRDLFMFSMMKLFSDAKLHRR